ncbi:MAG: bifunctional hydroxymethylpyrimidine kinase/phosphomethylpyrimidine kinase, partial [Kiritimatiellae bacterium]|nr:bifunctional hydroxymethylpyrimidine kinase/phosphomethylpyrimidine kinase [Kiritimatiellia bacterium]MBR0055801.1 bifunctional hydroxymethylpyrimidine kinase/phosphomethylpyrimidine kinase [Kiritimatiellia bacterium]
MPLKAPRAAELLKSMKTRQVLVVGDLMLDRFVYGAVTRISPEAPVPVVRVTKETSMPGGASNVATNLRALEVGASVAGMLGKDNAAVELRWLLQQAGVDAECAIPFAGSRTIVKERIIAERQQVVRVDFEQTDAPIPRRQHDKFLALLALKLESVDGVIVEDYGKGAVTQDVVDLVLSVAERRSLPVGLDPKEGHDLAFSRLTVATPNRKEAFAIAGLPDPGPAENPVTDTPLLGVASRLLQKWNAENVVITLGPQGMLLVTRGRPPRHVPTRAREVFDVSGAGDTVIAALVAALASGARFQEAAELSNYAAGVVVGKLGTASCDPAELLAHIRVSSRR